MRFYETNIKAIVLAAGKGTRLQTDDCDAPKVMRSACGEPLLQHVLDALSFIDKKEIVVVVGYKKDDVIDRFGGYAFAIQEEQLGTGHAVMSAETEVSGFDGSVLVCCGDMPAVRRVTYEALVRSHLDDGNDCTILTGESSLRLPYGRIVRSQDGGFQEIMEERDCTPEHLRITELNSGIYVFRAPPLFEALKDLKRDNAQGEYYLTDAPKIMRENGARVGLFRRDLGDEIIGVNTPEQLAQVEAILFGRGNK
jgi:UDP-N-acetylglucosamine diphosphorylase/glucosamine-1-phosphate N-acetyltransferase